MRTVPIESENLGLRYEGWRLVLTGLDSPGLGLAVTSDAGSLYPFGILVLEQVVNVALSKQRFQI